MGVIYDIGVCDQCTSLNKIKKTYEIEKIIKSLI